MIVKLQFCYEQDSRLAYIPNEYSSMLTQIFVDKNFFEWMKKFPSLYISEKGGFTYDVNDFLTYLNEEILKDSGDKAYFLPQEDISNWKGTVLYF